MTKPLKKINKIFDSLSEKELNLLEDMIFVNEMIFLIDYIITNETVKDKLKDVLDECSVLLNRDNKGENND